MMTSIMRVVYRGYHLLWVRGLGLALSAVLIAPILLYQKLISPALPPACKYHPSCSNYAIGALWVHGPFKGLALGTARLGRCNPWSKGGVDPVPSRGRWMPDVFPDGRPRPNADSNAPTLSGPITKPGA